MKRYVRCSSSKQGKIDRNHYDKLCDKLFKFDYDDAEYYDKLVSRVIKKELGETDVFDELKYINMLDEDVRNDLISLLENPELIHARRMAGKKKSSKKSSGTACKLEVRYEDYPDGNVKQSKFKGNDLRSALIDMVNGLLLYLDEDEIDEFNMSADDIIQHIEERNGDGCDFIITIKDLSTGKVLMDYTNYFEEEMWEGDL